MKSQMLKVIPQTLNNVSTKSEKSDELVHTEPTPTHI